MHLMRLSRGTLRGKLPAQVDDENIKDKDEGNKFDF